MNTAIPPTVLSEILASKSSAETIVSLLNEAEKKHSNLPRRSGPKRVYPFWKACQHCSKPFAALNRSQASRNKTCSKACANVLIGDANKGLMPLDQRKGATIKCAVCETEVWKPNAWLKKILMPVCSRECNGVLRGAEWADHAYKGRANWKPESEAALKDRMTGASNPAWKGGLTYRNRKGAYAAQPIKYVRCPSVLMVMARADGYVMEHRLVVALAVGRTLTRVECVHHINHNATDNSPTNLMLFATNGLHKAFEHGAAITPLWCGLCLSTTPEKCGACVCRPGPLLLSATA